MEPSDKYLSAYGDATELKQDLVKFICGEKVTNMVIGGKLLTHTCFNHGQYAFSQRVNGNTYVNSNVNITLRHNDSTKMTIDTNGVGIGGNTSSSYILNAGNCKCYSL